MSSISHPRVIGGHLTTNLSKGRVEQSRLPFSPGVSLLPRSPGLQDSRDDARTVRQAPPCSSVLVGMIPLDRNRLRA
jgi:hypothetical protein